MIIALVLWFLAWQASQPQMYSWDSLKSSEWKVLSCLRCAQGFSLILYPKYNIWGDIIRMRMETTTCVCLREAGRERWSDCTAVWTGSYTNNTGSTTSCSNSPTAQSCMCMDMNAVYVCAALCISPCHIRSAGTGSRVLCETLGSPAWTTAGWILVLSERKTEGNRFNPGPRKSLHWNLLWPQRNHADCGFRSPNEQTTNILQPHFIPFVGEYFIFTHTLCLIFRLSLLWHPCVEESIVKSSCFRKNTCRTEPCSTERDRKVFRSSTSVHVTASCQKSGKNVHIKIGWTLWWCWSELVLINTCDYVISRGNDLNDITGC